MLKLDLWKLLLDLKSIASDILRYIFEMWQIKSVFKKIKTGIRNGQSQYYSDFI